MQQGMDITGHPPVGHGYLEGYAEAFEENREVNTAVGGSRRVKTTSEDGAGDNEEPGSNTSSPLFINEAPPPEIDSPLFFNVSPMEKMPYEEHTCDSDQEALSQNNLAPSTQTAPKGNPGVASSVTPSLVPLAKLEISRGLKSLRVEGETEEVQDAIEAAKTAVTGLAGNARGQGLRGEGVLDVGQALEVKLTSLDDTETNITLIGRISMIRRLLIQIRIFTDPIFPDPNTQLRWHLRH